MVLKYDAYTETLEENQIKGKKLQSLEDSIRSLQESHREILEAINDIFNPIRNNDVNIACRSRGLGGEFEDD